MAMNIYTHVLRRETLGSRMDMTRIKSNGLHCRVSVQLGPHYLLAIVIIPLYNA